MHYRWAIVSCITTGLSIKHDELLELSILIITEKGIEQTFFSSLQPHNMTSSIPNSPKFEDRAAELATLFKDCIFVAHNARFSYAFIKNAFKAIGISFNKPVLCTLKLVKQHFSGYRSPTMTDHHFVADISHHEQLSDTERQASAIHQLLKTIEREHGLQTLLEKAKICYRQSTIPSKLATDLNTIPNSFGVYLFYGQSTTVPLYIGKSITLKQRIISHFQADNRCAKEFKMAQQVERIECIPTAGELSALLLESALIKKHMPIYNQKLRRKKIVAAIKLINTNDYVMLQAIRCTSDNNDNLYGSFPSLASAQKKLLELVKNHQLCPKLCHLEQAHGACFSYQLKRCFGACVKEESISSYNQRVQAAIQSYKEKTWPFEGAIVIKEECPINQLVQHITFDQWRYVSSSPYQEGWTQLNEHHHDTYQILAHYLKHIDHTHFI